MNNTSLKAYRELVERDAREFVCRLRIHDKDGVERKFSNPYNEQVMAIADLMSDAKTVVHLKPRQVGRSTLECAYNFYYAYWAVDAVKTLVVAHEADATDAIFQKIRHFNNSLPLALQRPVARSNKKELIFEDTGAGFRCLTAGGKGQGRAWTYQRLHADELAYWPDADGVWASVTSTMDKLGKHYRTSILSTPNGPGNFFHDKVKAARKAQLTGDTTTRFRFFKWSDHHAYRMPAPDGWEPTQEEYKLAKVHGLDWDQVYWRYQKIHGVDGIGVNRFRREYPLTVEEGFMTFQGCWFDAENLKDILSGLDPSQGELRIFERPERGVSYAIGVDPSWCNGGQEEGDEGDFAVAQVLASDGRQVAVLSCNTGGEIRFFEKVAELSLAYNKARVLIEANTGGAGSVGIRELKKAGIPLWYQQPKVGMRPSKHPKPWTTHHGNKQEGYSHLRQMVDGGVLDLRDEATVKELMHIREKNGSIEGQDGEHDDHAMALMLAEWNRRTLPSAKMTPSFSRGSYTSHQHPFSFTRPLR
jgi:hypothetical protein